MQTEFNSEQRAIFLSLVGKWCSAWSMDMVILPAVNPVATLFDILKQYDEPKKSRAAFRHGVYCVSFTG